MMTISSVGSAYTFLSTFSARRIFKLRDVIDEFDPEIERLQSVWSAEVIRREDDRHADYDIKQARNLMIELIGGKVAEQLREQLA
jgi:hypothetical protein